MAERRISFKDALNGAIRESSPAAAERPPFRTQTADLGQSAINLDRALQLAAELEDDDLVRKMRSAS